MKTKPYPIQALEYLIKTDKLQLKLLHGSVENLSRDNMNSEWRSVFWVPHGSEGAHVEAAVNLARKEQRYFITQAILYSYKTCEVSDDGIIYLDCEYCSYEFRFKTFRTGQVFLSTYVSPDSPYYVKNKTIN